MVSIRKSVEDALKTHRPTDKESQAELERYRKYSERVHKEGLVVRKVYDLPLIDTIGKFLGRVQRGH